jgi:hypothetical protein
VAKVFIIANLSRAMLFKESQSEFSSHPSFFPSDENHSDYILPNLLCYQSLVIVIIKDIVVVFILTNILIKEPVPVLQEPSSMISQDFIPLLAY